MAKHSPRPETLGDVRGASYRDAGALAGFSPLAGIVFLALALRALAWIGSDPVAFDSAVYFEMAERIRGGNWAGLLGYDYPPLYPLLIAALQGLMLRADTAGLALALGADLLVLVPLVAITRKAAGEAAALGAAFLWAVHLSAIRLGVQALSDAPTALLVAAAIWAGLWAAAEDRWIGALAAGLASGAAYLIRPEGMEPALALAVFFALLPARRDPAGAARAPVAAMAARPRSLRAARKAAYVVAPLVGWALIAFPYVAWISLESGVLTLSKKKSASSFVRSLAQVLGEDAGQPGQDAQRHAAGGEEPGRTAAGAPSPASPATQTPQGIGGAEPSPGPRRLLGMGRSLNAFQVPLVNGVSPLVLVFGCAGVFSLRAWGSQGDRRVRVLLAGLLVLHLAILVGLAADKGATYLGGHHFFLLVLYALPFAGVGLACTLGWLSGRWPGRWWVPAILPGLIVGVTAALLVTRGPDLGVSLRGAASWIRAQGVEHPVILTNLAKLTFHARAERVEFRGTPEEVLARLRARPVHFVAFYPSLVPGDFADTFSRLRGEALELAKVFPEPTRRAPDQRLEVYRLRPHGAAVAAP
jgi:hypothetical protein